MEDITKPTKGFLQSSGFHKILITLGGIVILLLVFQAGVFVGFRKASFSFRGGDNFYRAFGEDRRGPIPGMMHGEFPGANGSNGKILSISLPSVIIEDKTGVEKTILLDNETVIRKGRETLSQENLRVNDWIVAIGNPNSNAQISATFIRLLPPPPDQGDKLSSTTDYVVPENI